MPTMIPSDITVPDQGDMLTTLEVATSIAAVNPKSRVCVYAGDPETRDEVVDCIERSIEASHREGQVVIVDALGRLRVEIMN